MSQPDLCQNTRWSDRWGRWVACTLLATVTTTRGQRYCRPCTNTTTLRRGPGGLPPGWTADPQPTTEGTP